MKTDQIIVSSSTACLPAKAGRELNLKRLLEIVLKTKTCHTCNHNFDVMFRIQINNDKQWFFCCKNCTQNHQSLPHYKYGGTWKGKRH